jgi:hypothetical protein
LCTVRPPLNYSLTQGVGKLIIKTPLDRINGPTAISEVGG